MQGYIKYLAASVVCAGPWLTAQAQAQPQSAQYPVKPIRVVVPFAAGGGTDVVARTLGQKMSEQFGQQFVIDNRGGGGGLIGMEITAAATPDGYTILLSSGSYAAAMAIRKSSYDSLKDLTPVVEVATAPYAVAVHPSLPSSMKALLALARDKPNQLAYASTGVGGLTHLATELLLHMAKVKITHVPYKGAGPAMPDLLAGRSPILITPPVVLMPHFRSGRLRALAVTGSARSPELPDVPIVADTVPGYVVYTWYALFAPGGTPRPVVNRINNVVNKILGDREIKKSLESLGADVAGGSPEKLGKTVRDDYQRWAKVVRDNNITAD